MDRHRLRNDINRYKIRKANRFVEKEQKYTLKTGNNGEKVKITCVKFKTGVLSR